MASNAPPSIVNNVNQTTVINAGPGSGWHWGGCSLGSLVAIAWVITALCSRRRHRIAVAAPVLPVSSSGTFSSPTPPPDLPAPAAMFSYSSSQTAAPAFFPFPYPTPPQQPQTFPFAYPEVGQAQPFPFAYPPDAGQAYGDGGGDGVGAAGCFDFGV